MFSRGGHRQRRMRRFDVIAAFLSFKFEGRL